jgi:hypothetical protein
MGRSLASKMQKGLPDDPSNVAGNVRTTPILTDWLIGPTVIVAPDVTKNFVDVPHVLFPLALDPWMCNA